MGITEQASSNKNITQQGTLQQGTSARLCLGILAPVDAGKTTLAESMFYVSGKIRKPGRVDHGNTFFDTQEMERSRGITIFSKQAQLEINGRNVTLLDTPGHVDFSAETERTLSVLDAALLLISGSDGVAAHARTLWKLLKSYKIPVIIFVNKMDMPGLSREWLKKELTALDERIVFFDRPVTDASLQEEIALCDEELMEQFLCDEPVREDQIRALTGRRAMFPCFFGSALKMEGIEELLRGISHYFPVPDYPDEFGARIYKITRSNAVRLTHMKITGGSLKVKQLLMTGEDEGEKAEQIRLYDGTGYVPLQEAEAGTIVAVTGLKNSYAGQGLGAEKQRGGTILIPVLSYEMNFPPGTDVRALIPALRTLEEEYPEMHLTIDENSGSISAAVMGEVQIEILTRLILERTGKEVVFGEGRVIYKETVGKKVEGMGHFEPLRHYAEVHLILEPMPEGSGISLASIVPTDQLASHWQHLILSHLEERKHPGVLTGSELTDVKITLAAGKAHLKHTEGGDFRQAVFRALRQGLMKAESILLEPWFDFRLELPQGCAGRAMADLQTLCATFELVGNTDGRAVLTGSGPVCTLRNYHRTLQSYTAGEGRLELQVKGYRPCHNTEEVLEMIGYDPDLDAANPCGSVFCSHGAGYYVPWDEADKYMHLGPALKGADAAAGGGTFDDGAGAGAPRGSGRSDGGDDYQRMTATRDELEEIFRRTYGQTKRERQEAAGYSANTRVFGKKAGGSSSETAGSSGTGSSSGSAASGSASYGNRRAKKPKQQGEPWLLVDGYNMIFDWDELRKISDNNMDAARMRLQDMLSNYAGFRQIRVIVVFDAYRVAGGAGENFRYHNIDVIYTKEAETADTYIERTTHELAGKYDVTVATSDGASQIIIWGEGAKRLSAREMQQLIKEACLEIQREYLQQNPRSKVYLFDNTAADLAAFLEDVRLGRKDMET